MAYTPPFDPLNPPKGVITVTDKAPGSLFNPTLSNSHRYLLKCPAARTRPVIINGGGDVVLKGLHLTLHTAVGEMVKISGGAPGRTVHIEDFWLDPAGYSGDAARLFSFARCRLQWRNGRIEPLIGRALAGGFQQLWMQDVTACGALELGQQATLTGSTLPITSAVRTGSSVDLGIHGHHWTTGQFIQVVGINPAGFNGSFRIDSVSANHVTVSLGDAVPGAYVSGGSARQIVFNDPVGEVHIDRCNVPGHAGMATGFRFGARGASPFPNDYQTRLPDQAWNGPLEITTGGLYITPPSGTPGDMWVAPSGAAAVWDLVQAHLASGQVSWTWPKVSGHLTVGMHASGHDACEIVGGKPQPMWTAPPVAPTISVTITGVAQAGQTLTAVEVVTGVPTPFVTRSWYKRIGSGPWQQFGGDGVTQPLSDAETGWQIKVTPLATNDAGSATADSAPTAVVVAAPQGPSFTSSPTLSGGGYVGGTLTVAPGAHSGSEPITSSYRWLQRSVGGEPQAIATGTSLPVTAMMSGLQVAAEQTLHGVTNTVETTTWVTITATLLPAVNVRLPAVTPMHGLPINPGDTVRGDDGRWSGTAPITMARRWYLDAALIAGESGQTYHVRPTDVGHALAYAVVPTNAAGPGVELRSPLSPLVEGAVVTAPAPGVRLGCGVYDVLIVERGGRTIRHYLDRWTGLKFSMPVGSSGTGSVSLAGLSHDEMADCCNQLRDVLPWADEMAIYRRTDQLQGDLVWVGPVGDPSLNSPNAEIPALDLAAWFDVRLIRSDLSWDHADMADVAAAMVHNGLEPDTSPRIAIESSSTGMWWSETVLAGDYVMVGERLRALSDSGLRWYMRQRTFVACADPDPPLILTNAHFMSPPQVRLVGSSQATRTVVTGAQDPSLVDAVAVVGDASVDDSLFGLIERVRRSEGTSTDAVQGEAERWVAEVANPIYVVESGVLSEDAPLRFSDLAPGRRCQLSLDGLCYPVYGDYRLVLVEVDTTRGEVITVHFIPA